MILSYLRGGEHSPPCLPLPSVRQLLRGGSAPTGPPILAHLVAFCLILKIIQNSIQKSALYGETVKFFNDMLWI